MLNKYLKYIAPWVTPVELYRIKKQKNNENGWYCGTFDTVGPGKIFWVQTSKGDGLSVFLYKKHVYKLLSISPLELQNALIPMQDHVDIQVEALVKARRLKDETKRFRLAE